MIAFANGATAEEIAKQKSLPVPPHSGGPRLADPEPDAGFITEVEP